ncbi:hypothetical protein [Phenylobacterium immobile]|uniref:hypothetical protein n=1 Tax=Phenylobacterium immobile TaxID=21 RepID=UPI000AA0931B|nr:hypothetical protein [Phenylobacterium immobile]
MLSVIIDAQIQPERLMGLLAALAEGVVEGVVREVQIVAATLTPDIEALCEETGARTASDVASAVERARSELLLIAPTGFRPRDGWAEAVARHLRDGGVTAKLAGRGGGFLRPAAGAVILRRDQARGADFGAVSRGLKGAARL